MQADLIVELFVTIVELTLVLRQPVNQDKQISAKPDLDSSS
jgi:hypothetical protein